MFMPNLEVTCTATCKIVLFKKIAASLHHSHDVVPKPLAGGHGVPQKADFHLCDFGHQAGDSGVGGSVGPSLTQS
jgi:hypothetical protein